MDLNNCLDAVPLLVCVCVFVNFTFLSSPSSPQLPHLRNNRISVKCFVKLCYIDVAWASFALE